MRRTASGLGGIILLLVVLVRISNCSDKVCYTTTTTTSKEPEEDGCASEDHLLGWSPATSGGRGSPPIQPEQRQRRTPVVGCVAFDEDKFDARNSSLVIIEAQGRIGNHLIAYGVLLALQKQLRVTAIVEEKTVRYLSRYFQEDPVLDRMPVFQRHFCNWDEMRFVHFKGTIDQLVGDKGLHRGKVLNLWPDGYLNEEKRCCPAIQLLRHVEDHALDQVRDSLVFRESIVEKVDSVLNGIAVSMKVPRNRITFVGVHHRRTDMSKYLKTRYNNVKPLKKSYFGDAMDYFLAEYDNVVFLWISDDMGWAKKNMKGHEDIVFAGSGSPDDDESVGFDLALLAKANHTITTRGSFSAWGALLCGGEYYTEYGVIVPKWLQLPRKQRSRQND